MGVGSRIAADSSGLFAGGLHEKGMEKKRIKPIHRTNV
jgi:hypothetical protein